MAYQVGEPIEFIYEDATATSTLTLRQAGSVVAVSVGSDVVAELTGVTLADVVAANITLRVDATVITAVKQF